MRRASGRRLAWTIAPIVAAMPALAAPGVARPALVRPVAATVTGDANGDGVFDLKDPLALCRFLSGADPSLPNPDAADVNYDGVLDGVDVDLMMQAVLGVPLPRTAVAAAPTSLGFGSVTVGEAASLAVMVTNHGDTPIIVQSIAFGPSTSGAFGIGSAPATPLPLAIGGSVSITVNYAPGGTGTDTGSLVIMTTGADVTVPLSGIGVQASLSVSPLTLDFGALVAGTSMRLPVTITNSGTAALLVGSIAPGPGTSADFSIASAPATPFSLDPGGQATFEVQYAPHDGGDDAGTIVVLSQVGSASIALTGRGLVPLLAVAPAALDFGNVLVGGALTRSFDIRNDGTAALHVTLVATELGTSPDFSVGAFPATPFAVDPGAIQRVEVTYSPSGVGPATGRVEIRTDAGNTMVSLSGAGVAPEIDVEPAAVAFENVLVGTTASLSVGISNSGTADLTISAIGLAPGASPDISLTDVPALPLVLPPGSITMVSVSYRPAEVGGDTATLAITSDAETSPSVQLPITGNGVRPELLVQPNALVFSNVRVGKSLTLGVTIGNSGTADLSVTSLALAPGSSPDFTILAPPALPFRLAPGTSQPLSIRYAPSAPGGASGSLMVGTDAGAAQVSLTGNGIAPAIVVTPPSLDFGNVRTGRTTTLTLTIGNAGSDTLLVGAIDLAGGSAAFSLEGVPPLPAAVAPGDSIAVTVRYGPLLTTGDLNAVRIASDDNSAPTTTVPVSGNGIAPLLAVAPGSIDFGPISVGGSAELPVTLRNDGTADLTILSAAPIPGSSPAFTVGAPGTAALAPGASTVLMVTFSPTGTGPAAGSLLIDSDGGSILVPLSGSGLSTGGIASLTLSQVSLALAAGDCYQLRATATLTDGTTQDATATAIWASPDPGLATVGTSGAGMPGLVQAVAAGNLRLTATLGGFVATANVAIVPPGTIRLALPCGEIAGGTTVEGEITIDSGTQALGAYALRMVFDPAVLRIGAIRGGLASEFSSDPGADPTSFLSGSTVLAGYQVASLDVPFGKVSVARVSFEVIGSPGGFTSIALQAITVVSTDLSDIAAGNVPVTLQVAP